jgi:8-oxo-dGTP pyrophosphatase MutT (NUDIX family)
MLPRIARYGQVVVDGEDGEQSRWPTFGERVIYDNPWVWLGQVEVEPPGGARFWHHVIRLKRAAMMVLLDDQDRALLLWRHRFVQDKWGWELPGGVVEPGEDPAVTAERELEEETGYKAGRIRHLVTFQPMVGMVDSEHVVFTGREPAKIGKPTDLTEADRIEWVPVTDVPGLIRDGAIWNAGTVIALMGVLTLGTVLAAAGDPRVELADPADLAGRSGSSGEAACMVEMPGRFVNVTAGVPGSR